MERPTLLVDVEPPRCRPERAWSLRLTTPESRRGREVVAAQLVDEARLMRASVSTAALQHHAIIANSRTC